MTALVVAEHNNASLYPATLSAITAAENFGSDVDVLVAGGGSHMAAAAAALVPGLCRVLHAEADHLAAQTAENVAATVAVLVQSGSYSQVVAAATGFGRSVLPRVAALLGVEHVSEVVSIERPDTFVRPAFAGALLVTVRSQDPVKVVTVRSTAFKQAARVGGGAPIEAVQACADSGLSRLVSRQNDSAGRRNLADARVVVAGGRALGSAENFKMLDRLAARLDAAVGASRAAVDAGYAANHLQIGQSGKIVSPDLYIAVGISGAVQHLAGMKDSKVIVAINKDPEAPILQVADYAMVGDLFEIVPALLQELGA